MVTLLVVFTAAIDCSSAVTEGMPLVETSSCGDVSGNNGICGDTGRLRPALVAGPSGCWWRQLLWRRLTALINYLSGPSRCGCGGDNSGSLVTDCLALAGLSGDG